MGVVYEAEDTRLKRTVALKFLPPELTGDEEARERFIIEAQAASRLDHPNICTVHEIDELEGGQMYIAMVRYKGESLKDKIRLKHLDLKASVNYALQTAQGLSKAHAEGIVHRDIKPANLIVTEDGLVKIVDFGLAKLATHSKLTRTGVIMGTVAYMSPEQLRGQAVDQRTDIWSLGVVLYEMVTGRLAFQGEHEQAIVHSILNEKPQPLHGLITDLPQELENIINRCLEKDPANRFGLTDELVSALLEFKAKLTPDFAPVARRSFLQRTMNRIFLGATIGTVALAIILFLWFSSQPSLSFNQSDKLLVADVDNRAGDPAFDLALRTAIEADLQQSPYASIFDKGQVAETMRFMRKDPSARIDEELGCDICRFGGVRALILPRILSVGEAYELQAILVDPIKRSYVDRIRVTARGKEEVLLHAVDELASKVRSRLGETFDSIEKADIPVVKVTTSSWEALHDLTMGQMKWQEGKMEESAKYFELALEKDPHFPSARGSLGLVLIQFLNQKEKGKEMLRQARADADGLPRQEYLMINAVNLQFVDNDLEGALKEYRMIGELYPDIFTAYNNAGLILRELGRLDESVKMFEKAIERAPRISLPLFNLYFTYMQWMKDPKAAEEVSLRLLELDPQQAHFLSVYGWSLVSQGRFSEAIDQYKKAIAIAPEHPYALPNLAHLLLATGSPKEAIPLYQKVLGLVRDGKLPGMIQKNSFDLAFAMAQAGDTEGAKKIAAEGEEAIFKKKENASLTAKDLLIAANLEILKGRTREAKEYFNRALSLGVKDPTSLLSLAEAYALFGEQSKAIETLKKSLDSGYPDFFFPLIFPAFQSIRNDPRFKALFHIQSI